MQVLVVTDIPEIIDRVLRGKGISENGLAIQMKVSVNAVNAWHRGLRTPDPVYCWKLAEMAGLPVEEVMRAAGHLPPSAEPAPASDLPDWARLLPMLNATDAAYVGRLVETLARNPTTDPEEKA